MDYRKIRAELDVDPLGIGYAGMTDWDAAMAMNARTRSRPCLVPHGALRQCFDNMADPSGLPLWETIEAHRSEQNQLGVACRAALRTRDAPANYPPININSPMLLAQIDTFVAAGVMTETQRSVVLALGYEAISRGEDLGVGSAIEPRHIAKARALP